MKYKCIVDIITDGFMKPLIIIKFDGFINDISMKKVVRKKEFKVSKEVL